MNDKQEMKAVKLTKQGVELNGKYEVLLCGSLFYFRLPRAVWKDRIIKLKNAGYNCVDVYFPWNYHERADGSFDFSGERDVRYFLEELSRAGLYVIARPGPYICSEWNGGALPARILESGMPIRCADKAYLAEVEKWYSAILKEIAPYTYPRGGSVILLQIENELDFFDCPDPEAYTGKLAEIARPYLNDIPYFCCAGQFDATRAGGFAKGLNATLNCYPDSLDPAFDKELQAYGLRFAEINKPLLVSETNRDHFILRRELSCGSKLLGAYNQVAGINFEYYQAVNNWGSPDALLATLYDFWSMIDVAGNYREEAHEAILFSAFFKTAGQALAGSLPSKDTVTPTECSFVTTEGGLRVLELLGGGAAVCVPNFSETGSITFTYKGETVTSEVPKCRARVFLFGLDLSSTGIPAHITRATREPIIANATELVFLNEGGEPLVGLDFGAGEELFTKDGETHGVSVKFVGRTEALELLTKDAPVVIGTYTEKPLTGFCLAETVPASREVKPNGTTHFGGLNVNEGVLEYDLQLPAGKELFVEHPCDLLKVEAAGLDSDTYYADGRDKVLPASADGNYKVTAEKWGHSNFDDSQSPAIRTSCKKGVTSFGTVMTKQKVQRCDFELLEEYGLKKLEKKAKFPVRLSVDKWNTTRKPAICAYSLPVTRLNERLIVKTTENTDVAVYLDGALIGECDYGSFELTKHFKQGETRELTLVYRKRIWTQNCGSVTILHIDKVNPTKIRALTASEMCTMAGKGKEIKLPLEVKDKTALHIHIDAKEESRLVFKGKNVKITGVADGRVIGRAIVSWDHAPALHGGDAYELYWCPAWSGDLYLYVEALGKDATLASVDILSVKAGQPE
ncbi:MAG: beta-galactosidase [Clostridiales bacterium]|nr:beta-galactosidase [Clostridiales bacterium]